jgi:hypothetical protein
MSEAPAAPPLLDAFGFAVPEGFEELYLRQAERQLRDEVARTERWEAFAAGAGSSGGGGNCAPAATAAALARVLPRGPIRTRRLWCDDDGEDEREDDEREDDDDDDSEDEEDESEGEGKGQDEQEERERLWRRRERRRAKRRERRRSRRELDRLILGGVPVALRREVWPTLLRARERFPPSYFAQLLMLVREVEEEREEEERGGSAAATLIPEAQRAAWLRVGSSVLAQIDKDVPRTFPRHPRFDDGDDGHNNNAAAPSSPRRSLRRVLAAYAAHKPAHGYAQGMNMWAAGLMLGMGRMGGRGKRAAAGDDEAAPAAQNDENADENDNDEAVVFACLACVAEDVIPGYFCPAMVAPRADQRLLARDLLPERLPHVSAALRALFGGGAGGGGGDGGGPAPPGPVSAAEAGSHHPHHIHHHHHPDPRAGDAAAAAPLPGWLLAGFAGALPFAACCRCWDLFFYERTAAAPLRVALALLERGGRALESLATGGGGAEVVGAAAGGGGGGTKRGGGRASGGGASTAMAGDCADAAQLLQALPQTAAALDGGGGGGLVSAACSGRFCDLTGARVEASQESARAALLVAEVRSDARRAARLKALEVELEEDEAAAAVAPAVRAAAAAADGESSKEEEEAD